MAIKRITIPSNNGTPLLAAMKKIPFFTENYSLPETYVSSNGILISDKDTGDPLFKIKWAETWTFYLYKSADNIVQVATISSSVFDSLWGCDNGAILLLYNAGVPRYLPIRFVKNTKGKLAVILADNIDSTSGSASRWFTDSLMCVSFGDDSGTLNHFTISNSKRDQYEIVPMLTDCPDDEIVYTKDSGFLMYSDQSLTTKAVEINGTTYLVDGYFAIKDEEVSADG